MVSKVLALTTVD